MATSKSNDVSLLLPDEHLIGCFRLTTLADDICSHEEFEDQDVLDARLDVPESVDAVDAVDNLRL